MSVSLKYRDTAEKQLLPMLYALYAATSTLHCERERGVLK
jgi:hypothetical protein